MWSHYGDSHSGYCTSYYPPDIISKIEKEAQVEFVYMVMSTTVLKEKRIQVFQMIILCLMMKLFILLQINQLFKKFSDAPMKKNFGILFC